MASLLVFWGGVQNGFWAFSHRPTEYAKSIKVPTLLLYGEKDLKVSRGEIDEILANLQGQKKLVSFPLAGHEDYQRLYQQQWLSAMNTFFDN
jgi:pimeloyl-ACP methyl ester carboxylesterase